MVQTNERVNIDLREADLSLQASRDHLMKGFEAFLKFKFLNHYSTDLEDLKSQFQIQMHEINLVFLKSGAKLLPHPSILVNSLIPCQEKIFTGKECKACMPCEQRMEQELIVQDK